MCCSGRASFGVRATRGESVQKLAPEGDTLVRRRGLKQGQLSRALEAHELLGSISLSGMKCVREGGQHSCAEADAHPVRPRDVANECVTYSRESIGFDTVTY